MATVTKDVSNLDELKAALQSASSGDTLNINITKDITVGQPALPAPRAWVETNAKIINIYGNSHTISGINLPSQVYSTALIYVTGTSSNVYIHDVKILNALCVDTPFILGRVNFKLYLYNSTLTGNFNLFFKSYTVLEQCNIAVTTGHPFPLPTEAINSHIYLSLLTPTAATSQLNSPHIYTNSYIEINDKFGTLGFDNVKLLFSYSTSTCINLVSNVSGSIVDNTATKGVCVFNTTHAPNIKSTTSKVIGVTDDQMKNADYLNSIGFAVNETN